MRCLAPEPIEPGWNYMDRSQDSNTAVCIRQLHGPSPVELERELAFSEPRGTLQLQGEGMAELPRSSVGL